MLKLQYDAATLKIMCLQRYFHPKVLHPIEMEQYESYFILNEQGEPILIIEENT